MGYTFVFAVLSLVLNVAFSQKCTTPLGLASQCVTLHNCPNLAEASLHKPMQEKVLTFIRNSHCGFDGSDPKVCCGPLPKKKRETMRQSFLDPVNQEDSYPSRRGECGIDTVGERILGGQMMKLDEFPWMVLLGYRESDGEISYLCSGGLINHRYVMTAAHCVTGTVVARRGPLITARLGEYDIRREIDCMDGVCAYPVQEILVHRSYIRSDYAVNNKNKKNDIAIVRLTRRVNFTNYVKPICLPKLGTGRVWPGDEVFAAGWGKTTSNSDSPVKLKVSLSIFNKSECVRKYNEFNTRLRLTKRQICAGGVLNEDSCQGDSGGPLVMRTSEGWVSVGVVSFGISCGKDGWPGVYTSVPSYIGWIQSILTSSNQDGQ